MSYSNRSKTSTTKRSKQRGERINRLDQAAKRRLAKERRAELTSFYGVQACKAIFERRRHEITRIFIVPELRREMEDLITWASKQGIKTVVGPADELSRVARTEHHEGVCVEARQIRAVAIDELAKRQSTRPNSCLLVLEAVENPHNIGAILRTAGFFGVTGVVLVSKQITSLSAASCRVAEGAAELVQVSVVSELAQAYESLKKAGFTLVATTPHQAQSVYGYAWPKKVAIVFGAEGGGLSEQALSAATERVVIPRLGELESLNVGAAVASILTEVRRP
jgi:TrmH RNA methyltransferase